jgi:hypothetical protein
MSFELITKENKVKNDLINSNKKQLLLCAFMLYICFYTYFYVSTGLVESKSYLFIYPLPRNARIPFSMLIFLLNNILLYN